MDVNGRTVKRALTHHLSQGSLLLASSLVERALYNDALRHIVMKEIEKHVIAQMKSTADPHWLEKVQQDKEDMARAIIASADRALERRQISKHVLTKLVRAFLANMILQQDEKATAAMEAFKRRHEGQFPPATMVISPTSVCNLKCIGCYASSRTTGNRLEWEVFNRIVREAKDLWGLRFFTISGGEPLAYRSQGKTLLDMVQEHSDCFFMMYTNGTLIDEKMAERIAEAGNLTPAISVEGFRELTDERRGAGVFDKILRAMANLRQVGVPFGISLTATRRNAEEILSDEFIRFFFDEQQVVFGWLFQYMPIGRSFTLDLLITPQQRLEMWQRTWKIIRDRKIMMADLWNCGTVTNGCIAAGQNGGCGYLYIDWNGGVMPCTFVPYAAANLHEIYRGGGTLDDIYELPYFRAIRQWQREYSMGRDDDREYGNLLIPCSLRDHYDSGRRMIDTYQADPEDQSAAEALADDEYYRGMITYDRDLRKLFDPIWEREYVQHHKCANRP